LSFLLVVAGVLLMAGACLEPRTAEGITTAVTPDGRSVLLLPDGTWRLAEEAGARRFDLGENGRLPSVVAATLPLARVVRVVDGDTIRVQFVSAPPACMEVEESIRLLGVDTPELRDHEPYALEAKQFVLDLIGDARVRLSFDYVLRDRYHRLLAYVFLPDRRCLNLLLVEEGMGVVYPNEDILLYGRLRECETRAREKGLGLWGAGTGNVRIRAVHNEGSLEYVVVFNDSDTPVNLRGWQLRDAHGNVLVLPGVTLAPGDACRFHSGAGGAHDPPRSFVLTDKNIWGNSGDTASLFDPEGVLVDRLSYPE